MGLFEIHFEKVSFKHKEIIFRWLAEPHVQEFWDNSQAHKDDIINFINGRQEPSTYADGRFVYWIGALDGVPFSLIMTIKEFWGEDREQIKNDYLSTIGSTYGLDYMIGEKKYFGKGLGAKTLEEFTIFFQEQVDNKADTFFIDPDVKNPRAKHVYEKAGFKYVGDYLMEGTGVFRGHKTHLLVKKLSVHGITEIDVTGAVTMNDYQLSEICKKLDIKPPRCAPTKIHGGLLHLMWKLDSDSKSYAIKQLSQDINLTEDVKCNYELTENIAFRFAQGGISAVNAIEIEGKHLIEISNTAFLVYPWVDAKALDKDAISKKHALKIPAILAKMHLINLEVPELLEPEFDIHQPEKINALIDKAISCACVFSNDLMENQDRIAKINSLYQEAIPSLKETSVVSHGDLDQKNILWTKSGTPILIDWESARKLNPTHEIIDAALNWSGVTTNNFDKVLFIDMLKAYLQAGATINKKQVNAAFYGVLGNWLNWMVYNIERACKSDPNHPDQRKMGIEQVQQVLPTVIRLELMIPELTLLIEGI